MIIRYNIIKMRIDGVYSKCFLTYSIYGGFIFMRWYELLSPQNQINIRVKYFTL